MSFFGPQQRKGYGARKAGARAARAYGERGVQDTTAGALAGGRGVSDVASQYYDIMMGRRPSLAEKTMQRGFDRAVAESMGMAAGARGSGRALAQRTAQQQMSDLGAQQAQEGGIMRLQEQEQARQGLLGAAGQAQQQQLALEQLMQQKYATEMGMLSPMQQGMGSQILGGIMGMGGSVLGGLASGWASK